MRLVLLGLAGLLVLVLLAVAGVFGYVALRPLGAGEHSLANHRLSALSEQVSLVAERTSAALTSVQGQGLTTVETAALGVTSQLDVALEASAELDDLRAAEDPRVADGLAGIQTGLDELERYLDALAAALPGWWQLQSACSEFLASQGAGITAGDLDRFETDVAGCEQATAALASPGLTRLEVLATAPG